MSQYDPDCRFSWSSLSRLEAAGIPVVTSLAEKQKRLVAAIGVTCDGSVEDVTRKWLEKKKPTWRLLYDMLKKLDLEELSEQIEDYLSCEFSHLCI